eukprot:sb/3478829/
MIWVFCLAGTGCGHLQENMLCCYGEDLGIHILCSMEGGDWVQCPLSGLPSLLFPSLTKRSARHNMRETVQEDRRKRGYHTQGGGVEISSRGQERERESV